MYNRAVILATLAMLAGASYAQSTATLKAVDLYRSDQVTLDFIEAKLGGVIRGFARQRGDTRKMLQKSSEGAKARLEKELSALGRFAYVRVHYAPYITSLERTAYITIDLVDEKHAAERMPFRPAPKKSVADPDGLLSAWRRYSELGERLRREGAIDLSERPACPSYYCVYGSAKPELAELEKKLVQGVVPHKKALLEVFHDDADAADRTAALYALAYAPEGREVVDLALTALKDPAVEVRSAALQILADIALYHKSVFVDLTRLLPALDYPSTPERSLAMGALVGLADNPTYRPYLIARGAGRLLELLKLQQPSNHDLAFTLLSMLSKESFGRRDYEAWGRWVFQQQSATSVQEPKPQ